MLVNQCVNTLNDAARKCGIAVSSAQPVIVIYAYSFYYAYASQLWSEVFQGCDQFDSVDSLRSYCVVHEVVQKDALDPGFNYQPAVDIP